MLGDTKCLTFLDEVRQQPVVLQKFALEAWSAAWPHAALQDLLNTKESVHIVLTGMGSSLFACYIAMGFLLRHGIHASTIEALELQKMPHCFFSSDTIVVAVSQSGESPEVVELLNTLPRSTPVIGVTNYPKSHLYQMATIPFLIYAGTEYFTSTKSYTNTLAAMLLLAHRIAGYTIASCQTLQGQMFEAGKQMQSLIENNHIGQEIASFISDIRFLVCVGSGYSYTSACHSEIVSEEAGGFYASSFSPAQFIHGPIELIHPGFGVIVYDFDPDYHDKCDEVRESVLRYGGKVLLITNRSDIPPQEDQLICVIPHMDPVTSVLVEVLPLELGINALCQTRGVETGHITRVVKRIAN